VVDEPVKKGHRSAAALQKSYDLARALNVTGTPTYIIGDQIIPGAVPLDSLKASIANMRACGSAVSCPNAG
jgi:protein-disulfide isomerase